MKKKRKGPPRKPLPTVRSSTGQVEPLCRNCLCYDGDKGICKVVVLINNKRFNMPVFPDDHCHMDQLGIKVEQVRWWTEDAKGIPTKDGSGVVKIEYPDGFFGPDHIDPDNLHEAKGHIQADPEVPPLPPATDEPKP